MHDFATCPQCNLKLQAFYLKNADETQLLEIDGCRKCGGQWFDSGELERVVGKKLELQWRDGQSHRLCARCRNPMKAWKTKAAGVELEKCESCRGIFLDANELSQLGAAAANRAARGALVRPGEFECLKCFRQFPMGQGNAYGHGLVCRGCVPMPGEEVLDRFIPANNQRTLQEQSEGESGLGIIADIIRAVLLIIS
jgi:Zn-finger nucleic acid-binding protein